MPSGTSGRSLHVKLTPTRAVAAMRELNILISNVGDRAHNGALNRNRRGAQWCTPPAALVNQFRTSSLSTPALSTRLVCEARTLSPFAGRGHRKTVLRIDWRRLHQFQSHRRHTAIGYSQSSGSSVRKVNDPRFHASSRYPSPRRRAAELTARSQQSTVRKNTPLAIRFVASTPVPFPEPIEGKQIVFRTRKAVVMSADNCHRGLVKFSSGATFARLGHGFPTLQCAEPYKHT